MKNGPGGEPGPFWEAVRAAADWEILAESTKENLFSPGLRTLRQGMFGADSA